jgi:hypothetical protein
MAGEPSDSILSLKRKLAPITGQQVGKALCDGSTPHAVHFHVLRVHATRH